MDPSLCALIVGAVFAAVGITCHLATKDREQRYAELKKVVPVDANGVRPHEGKIVALRGTAKPILDSGVPMIVPGSCVSVSKYRFDHYTREIVYNQALKIMEEKIIHRGSQLMGDPLCIDGVHIHKLPDRINYEELSKTIMPLRCDFPFNLLTNDKVLDVIHKYSGVRTTTKLTAIGKVVKDSLLDDFSLVPAGIISCVSDKTLDEQIAEVAPCSLDYIHVGAYAVAFGAFAFTIVLTRRR